MTSRPAHELSNDELVAELRRVFTDAQPGTGTSDLAAPDSGCDPDSGVGRPPVRSASDQTGGRGAVPTTAPAPGPPTKTAATAEPERALKAPTMAAPAGGTVPAPAVPPAPYHPDRTIGEWWEGEPDPKTPLRHVLGALVAGAGLWWLLLVGLPGRIALALALASVGLSLGAGWAWRHVAGRESS